MQEYELALSDRYIADLLANKTQFINFDPRPEFNALSDANKRALKHLVRASLILNDVFLKQDHPDNIPAREFLQAAAETGDQRYADALTLFTLQNGVEGTNMYAKKTRPLRMFKNTRRVKGGGVYPADITEKELVDYVLANPQKASALLGNNTIVIRDGAGLQAVPYSVAYQNEMNAAARELLLAARETDHEGLARYLRLQAQALTNDSDPEFVVNADKTWIDLENSPLEFSITRENYKDLVCAKVAAHPKVATMMQENGIIAKGKDIFGIRVGIVNQESYKKLKSYRQNMDDFSSHLPLIEEYKAQAEAMTSSKMTFADVDLIAFAGDQAAYRGGFTIAQNLPNSDKLSVQLAMGNRLVFHRQIRAARLSPQLLKMMDVLIDPVQKDWYDAESEFLFVVGHEIGHSMGPRMTKDGRDKQTALGKSGAILEENKADLISISAADYFVSSGFLSADFVNKMYLTWIVGSLPAKQPAAHEAHRNRSIMQINFFREQGAVILEKDGQLRIVPEKMGAAARLMLTEVLRLQLEGDPVKAQAFVEKYAKWNDALQYVVDEQSKQKPRRYRLLRQPLRDELALA